MLGFKNNDDKHTNNNGVSYTFEFGVTNEFANSWCALELVVRHTWRVSSIILVKTEHTIFVSNGARH